MGSQLCWFVKLSLSILLNQWAHQIQNAKGHYALNFLNHLLKKNDRAGFDTSAGQLNLLLVSLNKKILDAVYLKVVKLFRFLFYRYIKRLIVSLVEKWQAIHIALPSVHSV